MLNKMMMMMIHNVFQWLCLNKTGACLLCLHSMGKKKKKKFTQTEVELGNFVPPVQQQTNTNKVSEKETWRVANQHLESGRQTACSSETQPAIRREIQLTHLVWRSRWNPGQLKHLVCCRANKSNFVHWVAASLLQVRVSKNNNQKKPTFFSFLVSLCCCTAFFPARNRKGPEVENISLWACLGFGIDEPDKFSVSCDSVGRR